MRQTGIVKGILAEQGFGQVSMEQALAELELEAFEPAELQQKLVAMESQLNALLTLQDKLTRQGGMSRALALEAQQLLPEFAQDIPLGYFTEKPSATQLSMTMEELSSGMVELLVAGVLAVMLLIAAVLDHIIGKKRRAAHSGTFEMSWRTKTAEETLKDKAKRAEDSSRSIRKIHEIARDLDGDLRSRRPFVKFGSAERVEVDSIAMVLERGYVPGSTFLSGHDVLFMGTLGNSRYTNFVKEMVAQLKTVDSELVKRVSCLDQVLNHDFDKGLPGLLEVITVNVRGVKTLREVAEAARNERTSMASMHAKQPKMTLHDFMEGLVSGYQQLDIRGAFLQCADATHTLENLEARLAKLEKLIKDSDPTKGEAAAKLGHQLRSALSHLGQEISGFGQYLYEVEILSSQLYNYSEKAARMLGAVARTLARNTSDLEAPHWEEYHDKIEDIVVNTWPNLGDFTSSFRRKKA
jgi:hypothetical protein